MCRTFMGAARPWRRSQRPGGVLHEIQCAEAPDRGLRERRDVQDEVLMRPRNTPRVLRGRHSGGAPRRPGARLGPLPRERGQVFLRRLKSAAFAAVARVAEKAAVPRAVTAIPPPVEAGADEPSMGAGRGLIDPADATQPRRPLTGALHKTLDGKGERGRPRQRVSCAVGPAHAIRFSPTSTTGRIEGGATRFGLSITCTLRHIGAWSPPSCLRRSSTPPPSTSA